MSDQAEAERIAVALLRISLGQSSVLRKDIDEAAIAITAALAAKSAETREACREEVAAWMIKNSLATGHGDTIEDLLGELVPYISALGPAQEAVAGNPSIAELIKLFEDYEAFLEPTPSYPGPGWQGYYEHRDARAAARAAFVDKLRNLK